MCSSTRLISHVSVWVCKAKYPRFPLCCFLFAKKTISFKALTCFQSPKGFRLKTYGFVSNIKAPTMTWSCYVHIIWTIWLWQCSQQRLSGAILSFLGANMLVECKNMQEWYLPDTWKRQAARHWSRTSASGGLSKSEPSCHWSGKPSEPSGDSGSQWLCALERRHSGASPMWVNLWVHVSPYDHWVVWCRSMSGQEPEEESESELEEDSSSSLQWLCLTWIEALSQKWTRRRSCRKFLRCEICEAGNLTRNISWSGSQLCSQPGSVRLLQSCSQGQATEGKQFEHAWNGREIRAAFARHIKEASCGTLDCFPDASQAWMAWMFGLCKWLKMDVMNLSPQSCARVRSSMFWGRWFKQI